MKKLKLKALELGVGEVLSRAQLKNVLGGVNAPKYCYQCCVPNGGICGQCDSSGNGGCEGNGWATGCYCG